MGVYLDLQLQTGKTRLTEFLEVPEQRALFDALDLGSGDRVEIAVTLHRPGVYLDPGVFDYRRYLEPAGHLLDRHDPEPTPFSGSGPGMAPRPIGSRLGYRPSW